MHEDPRHTSVRVRSGKVGTGIQSQRHLETFKAPYWIWEPDRYSGALLENTAPLDLLEEASIKGNFVAERNLFPTLLRTSPLQTIPRPHSLAALLRCKWLL